MSDLLLKAMMHMDVPSRNHDFLDEIYFVKVHIFVHEILFTNFHGWNFIYSSVENSQMIFFCGHSSM
jgi:hypothetical protein